ncbi:MAG: hypothetical protein WCK16_02720, partial [Candidatus Moraniibacteriota bacterium]
MTIKFITERYPELIVVFIIIWATIKGHSFYVDTQKVCNDLSTVDKKVILLDEKLDKRIDSIDKKVFLLDKKVDLLVGKFNSLFGILVEN